MRIVHIIIIMLVVVSVSSCVSTERLTYLQENTSQLDSVVNVQRIQQPYRLQVNDLLSIKIKTLDQDLSAMFNPSPKETSSSQNQGEEGLYYEGFFVDARGNIRVPELGEVYVLGLTQKEVRLKIEELLYKNYFKEETSKLFVTVQLAGIRYTTLGEIGTGSQVLYKTQVTIMEAIANAGDIAVTGDRTDVKIVRTYPDGVRVHHIDLRSFDAVNSPYYFIQANDLIVVDPLPQKALGTGTTGIQSFTTAISVLTLLVTTVLLFVRL